jgi:DNA-directed RNA polymerase specialized sigma24 family protein
MARSFKEAFEAEFPPLYRYLRRRVGAAAAEDLAATTFAVRATATTVFGFGGDRVA